MIVRELIELLVPETEFICTEGQVDYSDAITGITVKMQDRANNKSYPVLVISTKKLYNRKGERL